MRIGGLRKFSVIDYPGKLAAVVFTQGCDFRCPFCYVPELVLPEHYQPLIPQEDVLAFLERRKEQLEGVVITGGEPTIQEDLISFLDRIKQLGYLVKIDTNGSHPEVLSRLIQLNFVNYIAMDVKAPLAAAAAPRTGAEKGRGVEQYRQLCGTEVDTGLIKKSIALIIDSGIQHEFRTTAVKALISPVDIHQISEFLWGSQRYFIQEFVPERSIIDQGLFMHDIYTEVEIRQFQKKWGHDMSKNQKMPQTNDSESGFTASEEIEKELVESAYVRHDHGGREHGHDWDDVGKQERAFNSRHDLKFQVRACKRKGKKAVLEDRVWDKNT
ncbi:MAG: anaerobic ribonucleoside-triphosphate reductase activating protein [Omnitrophica WOR_2 bacterium RIFCSPHIGHO2_02_FULL_52_10]|nr:MAG: anaerobic ribonucleoside-triphosphate reductase activating protein [Omnitrophica WOR_2 bacterium RIFCSPHIGHO2_02_FULL_52_10]